MDEMLLHYFWKNKIFSTFQLRTTDGRELKLARTGMPHQDAGPDFKQAVLKIDNMTWVGDVEIHIRSSDWLRHGHQRDAKYNSVILHVVYENDVELGLLCPTFELKKHISPALIDEYEQLSRSLDLLPCRSYLAEVGSLQFSSWLSRLAVERYTRKEQEVLDILHVCRESWHETIFRRFVTTFGFRTNAAAFEMLAKSLPYKYVLKHKDSRLQVYALVFGQAGMLETDMDDAYYQQLQSEYRYLRYKYNLTAIPIKVWNLLRLRPQNFPCIRLAQLSECLYRIPDLMEQILHGVPKVTYEAIADFEPNSYWQRHRHFGRDGPSHPCKIGRKTIELLLINTIIPIRLAFATFHGNEQMKEQAFNLLENVDFENNMITRQYVKAGFPADNALCSQAILELYHSYCTHKRCIQCDIGCMILKKY